MPLFDKDVPANIESSKLGAQRIRETRDLLNKTLGHLYTAADTIVPGAVVEDFLALNSVTQDKIKNGEVVAGKLGDGAVVAANIAPGAVEPAAFSADSLQMMVRTYGHVTVSSIGPPVVINLRNSFGCKSNGVTRVVQGRYMVEYDLAFANTSAQFNIIHVTLTGAQGPGNWMFTKISGNMEDYFVVEFANAAYALSDPTAFLFTVFSPVNKTTPAP